MGVTQSECHLFDGEKWESGPSLATKREGFGMSVFHRERMTVLLTVTFKTPFQAGCGCTAAGAVLAPIRVHQSSTQSRCCRISKATLRFSPT